MADRSPRRAWTLTPVGRAIATAAIVIVAAWLALPAFSIAYSEGFQPEIAINAHALRLGDPGLGDTLYPFDARLFLLTRLGTSLAVLGLQSLGLTGLDAFRLLGVLSLAVLLGTLLALLWRVYRVPPVLSLLCCILFPPVFEAAYLPNDNVPSAALACLGLAVFWTRPTLARTALAGLLLGLAALLRLDAALIAPAFAILLLTEVRGWGARAARAAIAGVLVAGIPVLAYRLCGLSFLDSFAAVNRALLLWQRPYTPLHNDLRTALYSFTALGAAAWLLGIVALARTRRWRDLALTLAVPLLYATAYRAQLIEGRYLLPLSPFILLAMAEGMRSIPTLPARARAVTAVALAAGLAVWIVPPPSLLGRRLLADDEGPRFIIGRAWNPLATLWWQARLRAGQAAVEEGIERRAAAPDPVVVTGFWSGDRLTTLMLLEHGFALAPERTPPACSGIAETFLRGSVQLLQVRTHTPFMLHHSDRLAWERAGLGCVQAAAPAASSVLLVNSGVLDSPVVTHTDPALPGPASPDAPVFSAARGPPPPLAPRLLSVLTGLYVADLPVGGVADALEAATPEDAQAAAATFANRATLLR